MQHNRVTSFSVASDSEVELEDAPAMLSTLSRRNTGSSNASAPRNTPQSVQSEPPVNKLRAATALALWYFFSIVLSVYNKHMFSSTGMDFRFPIITTALHQLAQILLSLAAIYLLKLPTPALSKGSRLRIIPASLASAGDIGLGNSSLLIVTLSFYTMLKSSALGFVLLFSVLFHLEAPSLKLVLILAVMTVGVFLMAAGEANFSYVGFFLVLGASCLSGLRWALVKLLLNGGSVRQKSEDVEGANNHDRGHNFNDNDNEYHDHGHSSADDNSRKWKKPHPVQTIMLLSPGMFVGLIVLGCIVEGPSAFLAADLWKQWPVPAAIVALLLPGILAFCMTWAEFDLLNTTGPLALAIGGICKEVATIIISVIVFGDKLSVVNSVGLAVTIASIAMYHYHRNE